MSDLRARIIATGSYLPHRVLSNSDLEKMVETSNEWILTRTGIKERRIADETVASSDMAVEASKKALDQAGIEPSSIDLIILCSMTPDYPSSASACLVQSKLGCKEIPSLDIQAACTGYIYALSTAKAYIESGMYEQILVVASDKMSSIVDYEDRRTCVLFGDGAGASIVSAQGKGLEISECLLGSDGEQCSLLVVPAGGSKTPVSQETLDKRQHFLTMEGSELFKHAVRRMEASTLACLQKAGLKLSEIEHLICHQANSRIMDAIAKRLELPQEKVVVTLDKYGNTSASTVPIALDELIEKKGIDGVGVVLLTAFGAGLTWGSILLKPVD